MENKKKKVYISGKITGLPTETAKNLFQKAETMLQSMGYETINPMKICPENPLWKWEDYMREDLYHLLMCDSIYMLNNWSSSRGARVEYAVAKEINLEIFFE